MDKLPNIEVKEGFSIEQVEKWPDGELYGEILGRSLYVKYCYDDKLFNGFIVIRRGDKKYPKSCDTYNEYFFRSESNKANLTRLLIDMAESVVDKTRATWE